MEIDPIIKQAIEIGIKLGIEAYRNERNANHKNKKILICKTDAERRFGRGVIRELIKRKFIFPYQFGIETMVDEEGDEITEPRGHIYYKLHEIIEAVEEGNILKCLQKRRTMKYNSK